jgi:AcrR family transcriptional regulator
MAERQARGRPRRGERRLITRAQLLDAAERVFARDGLRGASVDAIALEAGYSTGAVYSNFKGKEDLFLTLVEERIDPRLESVYEAMEAELAAGVPPLKAAQRFVSMLRGQREAFLLLIDFWAQAARDPTTAERFAQRHARLRATVGQLLSSAAPERTAEAGLPTDQLATVLIALANGLAVEFLADPDSVPDELLGHAIGALVQRSP